MIASGSDIKTLIGTIQWGVFWLLMVFLYIGIFVLWKQCDISADIREIRATVVQQAKECHNLDTMKVKK